MNFIQNSEFFSVINVLSALILTSIVYFLKRNKAKLRHNRCASLFDGPKTIPYFGNSLGFVLHPEDISSTLIFYTQKYGSRYRLWIGRKLFIVLADATDIENALMGNKFLNKGPDFHDLFGKVFRNGTFSAEGDNWRKSRRTLQHPLKTSVLENYVDIMNEESEKIVKKLVSKANTKETFDISDYIASATFAVICRSLYDLKESVSEEELSNSRNNAGQFLTESYFAMFYPRLIRKIKKRIEEKKIKDQTHVVETVYRKVISEGKLNTNENGEQDYDENNRKFIQYLRNDTFSNEDKRDEIVTYSVGGSETLTVTLSFTCLMLAMHNDIQEKVYEEQKSIFGNSDREVTMNDIKQMDYLEQVLKEVMRLFPLLPFFFRVAKDDFTLGDLILPANTELIFNVYALHYNSKYFPNPEIFDPERFSKENCKEMPKGCYLPFVIGPRNCIGKAFAMCEMKIICSTILRKYRIHTEMKREDLKLRFGFLLHSAVGYRISVSERQNPDL